jgi:hypothetical protein
MAWPRKRRTPARVRLLTAAESERVPQTGAVGSVQAAEISIPRAGLADVWRAPNLERLARAYWRHITRATLGLIRVVHAPDSRTIVLVHPRLALLRFHAPEYETGTEAGSVTWRIERGLLVSRRGRGSGFLRIAIRRFEDDGGAEGARFRVRLEVRNFYPWLRGDGRFARFGAWLYAQTQLRIHVAVCNSFLRSLSRLHLPPAGIGALSGEAAQGRPVLSAVPPGRRPP